MPDSWLKAGAQTTPNPIRVSSVAVTEYGRIDLYIGTSKPSNVAWPIQCRRFRIKIPTGQQATALTAVGAFISASATPTTGRNWRVERNTNDQNTTLIDVIPDSEFAEFDGTWRLGITLSGIEINTSVGTANITIEEETRKPGETSFTTRDGTVSVPKHLDDAQTFYFHSLRPTNTVIARDTKVQLNWEGSSNATYTVYYRDKNGTDRARVLTNPGGTWDSQAQHNDTFTDATNFTVKASLAGRDLYQTTHVRVADPIISVHQLAVTDKVTTDLQVDYSKELKIRKLSGGGSPITVSTSLDQSATANAAITTGSGGLTANGDVTIASAKTLKADKIGATTTDGTTTVTGNLAIDSAKILRAGNLRPPVGPDKVLEIGSSESNGVIAIKGVFDLPQWYYPLNGGAVTPSFKKEWGPAPTSGYFQIKLQSGGQICNANCTSGNLFTNVRVFVDGERRKLSVLRDRNSSGGSDEDGVVIPLSKGQRIAIIAATTNGFGAICHAAWMPTGRNLAIPEVGPG